MERFYASTTKFYEESTALLGVPADIASLKNTVLAEASERKGVILTAVKQLDNMSSTSNALTQQSKKILKNTSGVQEKMAKSVLNIMAIARDVKRILSMLRHFSQEMFAKIAANGYVCFDKTGISDRSIDFILISLNQCLTSTDNCW